MIEFIIGLFAGISVGIWCVNSYFDVSTRNPFRYECSVPNCEFSCSGTEMEIVDLFAIEHEKAHAYG